MKEEAAEGGEPPLAAAAAAAAAAATCWAKMDLLMGATAAWMFVTCSCSEIVERGPRKSLPQCGHLDTSCEEGPVSGDKKKEEKKWTSLLIIEKEEKKKMAVGNH